MIGWPELAVRSLSDLSDLEGFSISGDDTMGINDLFEDNQLVREALEEPGEGRVLVLRSMATEIDQSADLVRALAEAGILVETTSRARNRVWRSPEVLVAIDAFAERAGKRV